MQSGLVVVQVVVDKKYLGQVSCSMLCYIMFKNVLKQWFSNIKNGLAEIFVNIDLIPIILVHASFIFGYLFFINW